MRHGDSTGRVPPRRGLVGVALCAAVTVSCVGPARTFDAYEADAVATAEDVRSAAATALLAVDVSQADRTSANYLTVVLVDAEAAGSSAQSQFESVQPPGEDADDLSAELTPLLERVNGTLTELRVTVRRSEIARLPSLAQPLESLVDRLDRFAREHER